MNSLRYTLVTEGSSDTSLMPILEWLLRANGIFQAIHGEWADLGEVRIDQRISLSVKIREAVKFYPCDLLFVHRDADRRTRTERIAEIRKAVQKAVASVPVPPSVCVIPVRMLEAWLLFDEAAIRYAAGNRNSQTLIALPPLQQLELMPDPKSKLYECLRQASGLQGRRLKRFPDRERACRVSEFVEDFSPLRNLSAFAAMEQDIQQIIRANRWNKHEP